MRYVDPEAARDKRVPSNYIARQPYARPNPNLNLNRSRPPHQQQKRDNGEKWQRGFEARPEFRREQLDRELDNWGTKAQKEGAGTNGAGGRDFDDWRTKRDEEWADDRKQKREARDGARRSLSRSRSPVKRGETRELDRASPPRGDDEESDMVLDLD